MSIPGIPSDDRIAAVDIGSNSIRLVVAKVEPGGTYNVLTEEREMTRLIQGLDETGSIRDEAIERSVGAIARMKAIADGFAVSEVWGVATSAVREATNGDEFCRKVQERTHVDVEVISSETESRLILRSAAHRFDLTARQVALVDIGGGSVEVVLCGGGVVQELASFPLGAVRLADRFMRPAPWSRKAIKKLLKLIDRTWRTRGESFSVAPQILVGSGGTFTALAQVIRFEREGQGGSNHGYLITQSEVDEAANRLGTMSLSQLRSVPGVSAQRADILVPGAFVVTRLAQHLGVEQILVNEYGLRDGMLLEMIERRRGAPSPQASEAQGRLAHVRAFARKCLSHEAHCEHVANLAGSMFDQMRAAHGLGEAEREILIAAAILHDIGYLIGHAKHHKHAYHLIVHSAMPGFSTREVELIANVARYHRKARPRRSHVNYARLGEQDRETVKKLSAILRIADALDRTHLRRIVSLAVHRRGSTTQLILRSDASASVEIDCAAEKGRLFERVYRTRLRLLAAPSSLPISQSALRIEQSSVGT